MYLLTFNLHKANGVKSSVCREVPCKSDLESRHRLYSDKSPGRAALFLFMLFWHCFYTYMFGSYCEISELSPLAGNFPRKTSSWSWAHTLSVPNLKAYLFSFLTMGVTVGGRWFKGLKIFPSAEGRNPATCIVLYKWSLEYKVSKFSNVKLKLKVRNPVIFSISV